MIVGHAGLAAVVKSHETRIPLWSLMLATLGLDVLFIPLVLAGVEGFDPVPGTDGGYGESIIHADYTHSLIGALAIAALTGLLTARWWGRRSGTVLGGLVFSHWLLDLIMHRADMPILPGDLGDLPRLGLGLWRYQGIAICLELALLAAGVWFYWRAARKASPGRAAHTSALTLLICGLVTAAADLSGV